MTRETTKLAVLFADIAKSTELYETIGDKNAQIQITSTLSLLSEVASNFNGVVIKTIGDEVMCTFPNSDCAMEAAKRMHMALDEISINNKKDFTPVNIYIGFHYGQAIIDGNDVFGEAANIAARMVALAQQRQTLTTEETAKSLSPTLQSSTRFIYKTTIKGISGETNIFECIWEQHDVTVMMDTSAATTLHKVKAHLKLQFQDQIIEVDESRPVLTLGRQKHNDLIFKGERVSRSHARIEHRKGRFVITDKSSNGTYVIFEGKKNIHLKREETQLLGKGVILLGKKPDGDLSEVINFEIVL
ncbi:MAG: adenylate/guanylate cyclase domain-containing protein [Deltaproteobacteria bacterium]|nr:adenylate/guanylate cyclase domain-containing protein [Deltaproteobacteria bacterium]